MIGKGSKVMDTYDHYVNVGVNILLKELENHHGIVLLSSNLRNNLEPAFDISAGTR